MRLWLRTRQFDKHSPLHNEEIWWALKVYIAFQYALPSGMLRGLYRQRLTALKLRGRMEALYCAEAKSLRAPSVEAVCLCRGGVFAQASFRRKTSRNKCRERGVTVLTTRYHNKYV